MTRRNFVSGIAALLVPDSMHFRATVSSADHELEEGYFSLGDGVTIIAQKGTDLHGFLRQNRNKDIGVTLREWRNTWVG